MMESIDLGAVAIGLILGLVAMAVVFGPLAGWIAGQKGRDVMEGFWLGTFYGPLGVIVEGLLPVYQRQAATQAQAVPQAQAPAPPPPPPAKPAIAATRDEAEDEEDRIASQYLADVARRQGKPRPRA